MNDHQAPPSSGRATLLTFLFGFMVVGVVIALSLLFFGLFFLQALAVLGLLTVTGYVHYWLWGHALSREVEGEPPAEERPVADEDWPMQPPRPHRRF